jgi:hypothetical protein
MKRIKLFTVLMALFIAAPLALEAGGESWNKTAQIAFTGAKNYIWTPTAAGAPFRPEKLTINLTCSSVDACTLTAYSPLTAGPATATDSTIFTFTSHHQAVGVYYFSRFYWGDTIRVHTGANVTRCYITAQAD